MYAGLHTVLAYNLFLFSKYNLLATHTARWNGPTTNHTTIFIGDWKEVNFKFIDILRTMVLV